MVEVVIPNDQPIPASRSIPAGRSVSSILGIVQVGIDHRIAIEKKDSPQFIRRSGQSSDEDDVDDAELDVEPDAPDPDSGLDPEEPDPEPSVDALSEALELAPFLSVPSAVDFLLPAAAERRSFLAQPEPLNTMAGGANALRTGPEPHSGQVLGDGSWTPWMTSNRRRQAAQS